MTPWRYTDELPHICEPELLLGTLSVRGFPCRLVMPKCSRSGYPGFTISRPGDLKLSVS